MWGFSRTLLFSNFRFSPMMNRFFPANFPNKQYQLLFTQGSGESKEGTLACQSVSVSCSLVSTCSPLKQPQRLASCSLLCLCVSYCKPCQLCTDMCFILHWLALSLLITCAWQGSPRNSVTEGELMLNACILSSLDDVVLTAVLPPLV